MRVPIYIPGGDWMAGNQLHFIHFEDEMLLFTILLGFVLVFLEQDGNHLHLGASVLYEVMHQG